MVVDTSALVAFILDEEDADWFEGKLVASEATAMSGANFLEAEIVLRRRGRGADRLLDSTLTRFDIDIAAVTVEQAYIARDALGDTARAPATLPSSISAIASPTRSRHRSRPRFFLRARISRTRT